jgi:general stress protein YciG
LQGQLTEREEEGGPSLVAGGPKSAREIAREGGGSPESEDSQRTEKRGGF